jgi:hypothetical protein
MRIRMSILSDAKEIADLVQKIGDIDLYRKIVELEGQILELTKQKRDADEKVEKLTQALAFKETLTFKSPVYFAKGEPTTPYCPKCWEGQRLASHLKPPDIYNTMAWTCLQCEAKFLVSIDPHEGHKV